jgi:hypothetical protein
VIDFGQAKSNTIVGIAVDSGDLGNQIGLNSIVNNGSTDTIDANSSCGTNLWFNNAVGKASPQCTAAHSITKTIADTARSSDTPRSR